MQKNEDCVKEGESERAKEIGRGMEKRINNSAWLAELRIAYENSEVSLVDNEYIFFFRI